MKQPYIGNTKINKLYKGNELWCNWDSSGGGEVTAIDIIKHFDVATLTGSWMDSGLKGYNNTTTKYSKTVNSTCTWTFNVPLTSNYNIYVWCCICWSVSLLTMIISSSDLLFLCGC